MLQTSHPFSCRHGKKKQDTWCKEENLTCTDGKQAEQPKKKTLR